jgi:hypothetical protein
LIFLTTVYHEKYFSDYSMPKAFDENDRFQGDFWTIDYTPIDFLSQVLFQVSVALYQFLIPIQTLFGENGKNLLFLILRTVVYTTLLKIASMLFFVTFFGRFLGIIQVTRLTICNI